jgi:predicted transposase YbfD/YdcC
MLKEILKYLDTVIDSRQEKKVWHKMKDIILLVFFALLSNADEWTEIESFGREHEEFLRKYLELPHGIPSHDTIQRVMAIVPPEFLQKFRGQWNEMLNSDEGEKIKKILAIDGKTQCGNDTDSQKANHIVSCIDEDGFCLSEVRVNDKEKNEIKAIPKLLDNINIKNHIITTDAMGCQKDIAAKIRKKKADYVLALKGNHGILHEEVKLYFADSEFLGKCAYHKTVEKARSSIEKREYWQTDDIDWLSQKKEWVGLKSIAMTRNTITKNDKTTTETRYFISSLPVDAKEIARAIRGHWMVESFHWHLDVTFKEDDNRTIEKQAAYNLNILSKFALSVLKIVETGRKNISLKLKRFTIGTNPEKHLENIINL